MIDEGVVLNLSGASSGAAVSLIGAVSDVDLVWADFDKTFSRLLSEQTSTD